MGKGKVTVGTILEKGLNIINDLIEQSTNDENLKNSLEKMNKLLEAIEKTNKEELPEINKKIQEETDNLKNEYANYLFNLNVYNMLNEINKEISEKLKGLGELVAKNSFLVTQVDNDEIKNDLIDNNALALTEIKGLNSGLKDLESIKDNMITFIKSINIPEIKDIDSLNQDLENLNSLISRKEKTNSDLQNIIREFVNTYNKDVVDLNESLEAGKYEVETLITNAKKGYKARSTEINELLKANKENIKKEEENKKNNKNQIIAYELGIKEKESQIKAIDKNIEKLNQDKDKLNIVEATTADYNSNVNNNSNKSLSLAQVKLVQASLEEDLLNQNGEKERNNLFIINYKNGIKTSNTNIIKSEELIKALNKKNSHLNQKILKRETKIINLGNKKQIYNNSIEAATKKRKDYYNDIEVKMKKLGLTEKLKEFDSQCKKQHKEIEAKTRTRSDMDR